MRVRKQSWGRWGLLLVVLLLVTACGRPEAAGAPVKIAIQGPLTGQYAGEGEGFRRAVELLSADVNAEGGVLGGRPIQLFVSDDRADRGEAAKAARRLVDAGVVAVIGSYSSDATEAAAPIYAEAGVLHITPSSTATRLSEPAYPYFFRTCFMDDRQGEFAAQLMAQELGLRRVALVHDNTAYSQGLASWAQHHLEPLGVEVVLFDAVRSGQRDFAALLQALVEAEAEAVYFTAYYPEAALLARQMHAEGLRDVQFIGGDAVNNAAFVEIAGVEAAAGALITTMPLPSDLAYAQTREFVDAYAAAHGEPPFSIYTLTAADAFRLVIHAIQETQSDDPARLAGYLHDLESFAGISGPVEGYNELGERQGTIHVAYRVDEAGNFVLADDDLSSEP